VTPGGIALSDSEKAEALAGNLETQFQPVTDPSGPAVIETVDVGLRSYLMASVSEHNLTNREEVQEAIGGLKVGKAPGPERYTEQGFEASSTASGIPPGRFLTLSSPITSIQRGSTHE
jgi:hypothetical protein